MDLTTGLETWVYFYNKGVYINAYTQSFIKGFAYLTICVFACHIPAISSWVSQVQGS